MSHIRVDEIIPLPVSVFYDSPEYTQQRRVSIINMNDTLQKYEQFAELDDERSLNILRGLESGCYSRAKAKAKECNISVDWYSDGFADIYITFCAKIMNLFYEKDDMSISAMNRLLSGDIAPELLSNMRITDICPEQHSKFLESLNERFNVQVIEKSSSLYRCKKCKKNQCKIERMYDRALDEGQSIKITCLFCKYSWKG
jgi:DNA-directed RNA polymerase subunit M/transcription elongation factor TFIIS